LVANHPTSVQIKLFMLLQIIRYRSSFSQDLVPNFENGRYVSLPNKPLNSAVFIDMVDVRLVIGSITS
jgi:hypothetical protein